ncbi:MAG: ATP-binding protein, partial [Pirellula sp.]|nr:ATP-binding protein [Pirellula sp.]
MTASKIIGRETEQRRLLEASHSQEPELVALYGRRRVGKTFLVRELFRDSIAFELTGLHQESMKRQLESFANALRSHFPKARFSIPSSWLEAFESLRIMISEEPPKRKRKRVLFFDEFPWLETRRSGFLAAFEHFWNTFASQRNDLLVVICGSAASWMIRKVIGSKGGLHNRTTVRIRLEPFSLGDTRKYLER